MAPPRTPSSQTLAAMLRSVNVGGRNKLAMTTLRSLAERLGFTEVVTYLQSGNLVFTAPAGPTDPVAAALESAVSDQLGVGIRVLLRSAAELTSIVAANPF